MGDALTRLVNLAMWITGIIVALAVGFGLINEVLTVPMAGPVDIWAGWVVVVLTIVGAVLAILDN